KEVVEKARNKDLRGWSFDFVKEENGDVWEEKDGKQIRTLTNFIMSEVSLIDKSMIPCYSATSLEIRGDNEEIHRETRATECEVVTEDIKETQNIDYSVYENKIKELERK
ncbi:MAG TPA: HK97 family phage prohead protease, partial [Flavobacteriaceae bacterium]|nr:HK97 family phage prohead protease [Flavobacteriaceae bacterium]